jgi:hypothetical protein
VYELNDKIETDWKISVRQKSGGSFGKPETTFNISGDIKI